MKTKHALLIVVLAIGLQSVMARRTLAMPPLPSSFYGTAKVNGQNVPAGTIVEARISGVTYAHTTVMAYGGDTVYSMDVPGDDPGTPGIIEGGLPGDTIVFYMGATLANQTGTWQSGTNVNLDLSYASGAVPANIIVEASPLALVANTGTTATVTATVRDAANQPVAGVVLNASVWPSTLGVVNLLNATNASGQAIGTWTAGGMAGIGTLRVSNSTITTTLAITLNNPLPTIISLNPLTVTVGSPPFTLTVTGTNFVNGSLIHWNGAALATAVISGAQLQALIATESTLVTGTVSLTVTNPSPGGGVSNVLTLIVEGPSPAPKDRFIYLPIVTRSSPTILLRKQNPPFVRLRR